MNVFMHKSFVDRQHAGAYCTQPPKALQHRCDLVHEAEINSETGFITKATVTTHQPILVHSCGFGHDRIDHTDGKIRKVYVVNDEQVKNQIKPMADELAAKGVLVVENGIKYSLDELSEEDKKKCINSFYVPKTKEIINPKFKGAKVNSRENGKEWIYVFW